MRMFNVTKEKMRMFNATLILIILRRPNGCGFRDCFLIHSDILLENFTVGLG